MCARAQADETDIGMELTDEVFRDNLAKSLDIDIGGLPGAVKEAAARGGDDDVNCNEDVGEWWYRR
eukprot:6581569-Pyramimonas_sp.AAC.1